MWERMGKAVMAVHLKDRLWGKNRHPMNLAFLEKLNSLKQPIPFPAS
jgi:hypothetical protein